MRSRTLAREIALQLLYEYDTTGELAPERIESFLTENARDPEVLEYGRKLVTGVIERRDEFDGIIQKVAEHWALNRMPVVDRNVLRLGIFELMYNREVPDKVVINEAVDMAKRYGTADSGRFVNAILDRIRKEHTGLASEE